MPLQATSGAASYDAFGGGVPAVPNYIEDVFSTYLYTGNSSTQTITNGIDLSGKGGLVWIKNRNLAGEYHYLWDTVRGNTKSLSTNLTDAQANYTGISSFNSNGFTEAIGYSSASNLASWTFRKQPKFFDVVTFTESSATGHITVNHNLGSTPGCIMVKRTDAGGDWYVYHRSLGTNKVIFLNYTDAAQTSSDFPSVTSTSFQFTNFDVGATYVAYIFAHDAGGFGLTGTDNVISCGSFTTDGSGNATVSLGYEPQWFLAKKSSDTGNWFLTDTMRKFTASNSSGADTASFLLPNTSDVEAGGDIFRLNSTGVSAVTGVASDTYIYIAIRRGPMKVPTSGTSVFGLSARTGTGANATVTGGQTDDAVLVKNRGSAVASLFSSRLTGTGYLVTSSSAAEVAAGTTILQANPWDVMDGVKVGTTSTITNASGSTFINYLFKRAPSFFDEVCYTGDGANGLQVSHNLGIAPELIILKNRGTGVNNWQVSYASNNYDGRLYLNTTDSLQNSGISPVPASGTSTYITLRAISTANTAGLTYVGYLFATCAGVSKVGSYTGNGTTQTIDCGLTAGARFVLIKRTDAAGDWYIYDTARGMTTLTDPYIRTNSTAAESATLGSVTTVSTGFALDSTILAAINVSSGTYIFLAIA